MTVQHVHVAEGGQAIVGNVSTPTPGVGAREKAKEQPHALGYAPGVEMPRRVEAERATVPGSRRAGHSVCRMHGATGGAPKGNRNALKHGEFTAESLDFKKRITGLTRMVRKTMSTIE